MKKLEGNYSSIRELLFGACFGIDCSQREYRWGHRNRSSNDQYTKSRREQKTLNTLDVL